MFGVQVNVPGLDTAMAAQCVGSKDAQEEIELTAQGMLNSQPSHMPYQFACAGGRARL